MQLSLFYIEVAINETALIRTQFSNLMADRELDTMQCLITCFEAIQGWFNLFLTLDITEYVGVPFTSWKQLGLMIVTTVRLTTLEDPAWDTNHIRQELDLPSVLEAICENLRHVANLTPWKIDAEDNVYLRSMKYMNGLLTWARSVYAGFPVEAPTIDPVNGSIQHESGQIDMMTGENNSRQQQQQQQRQQNPSASLAPGQTLGPASAPATASAVAFPHQTQLPLPAEMFPYFHQDPWADGVLGFWDIYNNGKTYGNIY